MRTSQTYRRLATCSSLLIWAATSAVASGCSLDAVNPSPTPADAGPPSATQTNQGGGFVADGFTFESKEDCLAHIGNQLLILDRDGDGKTAWWSERCNDFTQLPTGSYRGNVDCDDTDPTVSQQAWRDADGDGWTVGDAQCLSGLPDGYRASQTQPDCDDSNPDLNLTVFADKDGDGFGTSSQPSCVAQLPAGAMPGPGTSLSPEDCNDDDANVHPGAHEQWRDGVDSDCDGKDDPLLCNGPSGDCGCELLGIPSIAIDQGCPGPDLFLAKQAICQGCGGRTVVAIGNRGSGPSESVAFSVDGEPFPVQGRLEAGAITLPIILPYGAMTLAIAVGASECNADNNVTAVASSAGICDP